MECKSVRSISDFSQFIQDVGRITDWIGHESRGYKTVLGQVVNFSQQKEVVEVFRKGTGSCANASIGSGFDRNSEESSAITEHTSVEKKH